MKTILTIFISLAIGGLLTPILTISVIDHKKPTDVIKTLFNK